MSHNPRYSPYSKSFEQFSSLHRRKAKKKSLFSIKKEWKISSRRQSKTSSGPLQLALFEEKQKRIPVTFEDIKGRLGELFQNPKTIMAGLLMISVLLGVAQLPYSHDVATKSYDLKRLEVAQKELMDKYERVNIQVAQAKSSQVLASSKTVVAMHRARSIDYVEDSGMAVVASSN